MLMLFSGKTELPAGAQAFETTLHVGWSPLGRATSGEEGLPSEGRRAAGRTLSPCGGLWVEAGVQNAGRVASAILELGI